MSKLLSILVAAVFALSTGSVFAASHAKAGGEMKKEEMKKEMAKPAEAKPAEAKGDKKEMKKAKKAKKEHKEMKKDK